MNKEILKIDEIIKEELTQEESKLFEELDEQNIFRMLCGVYKGKNGWLIILINIFQLAFLVLFIYCAIKFFNTEETNELIRWGVFGSLSIFAQSMLKFYTWMQMDKNSIIREMKRLEFQVSILSSKLSS